MRGPPPCVRCARRPLVRGGRGWAAALFTSLLATPAAAQGFAPVDRAVQDGIRRGLYPGAVVIVGRRDSVLYAKGYGRLTWRRTAPRPDPAATLWDLASVSKVLGTASVALRFVDQGLLDLEAPVQRYLPGFAGPGKERVTVRMLLNHTSGLKAFVAYFRVTPSAEAARDSLLREPLQRPPGDSAVYSDLNAILLGLVLEAVGRQPLGELVTQEVLLPLQLRDTHYTPESALWRRVAPTDHTREAGARGVVHDENAAFLGGIAGHAGLFATATDLARFARVWLAAGETAAGPWVRPATMVTFLERTPGSGSRLLGWDSPERRPGQSSMFGTLAGTRTYGHTGWTGTALWIDPVRDLFLVFLTNRSYDPRTRRSIEKLRGVRGAVSDAVIRASGG